MKTLHHSVIVFLTMLITQLAVAHEGMHGAGQVHMGEHHMGMFEVTLAVLAMMAFAYGLVKVFNSKK